MIKIPISDPPPVGFLRFCGIGRCGTKNKQKELGGGFKCFFYFHPYLGKMIQFDEHILSDGLVNQPPTRKGPSQQSLLHPRACTSAGFHLVGPGSSEKLGELTPINGRK